MNEFDKSQTALFGFAEVDITPDYPVETIGFGRDDNLSRGILHPLSAQISVWELCMTKCCLITIDHIGFLKKNANLLRLHPAFTGHYRAWYHTVGIYREDGIIVACVIN